MSQRPALAFDDLDDAMADRDERGRCYVVAVPLNARVSTYWSVPIERSEGPGAWRRGAYVDPDPTQAMLRPTRLYDWQFDPELAA